MRRLSIGTRLIVFSSALLGVLIATNLYLITELVSRSGTVIAATELLAHLQRATAAATAFGDIQYWLTDPATSQLALAAGKAREARVEFDRHLEAQSAELFARFREWTARHDLLSVANPDAPGG